MLHNTLSAILVSVASRYAQLSPSDVGIGIGGGRLVIDDVKLRADTFNGPHIPFHVRHGRAGRLRVNVPWGALSSAPVQVYLENVHLIATPKEQAEIIAVSQESNPAQQSSMSPPPLPQPPSRSPRQNSSDHAWHQTNVGRLLFNISVEVYGLKIEYRDKDCVGVLSVASLRAFSAGPDWSMRFVSFSPDLDDEQPDASAVSMRKIISLTGVHLVMIPRAKPNSERANKGPDHQTVVATGESEANANTQSEPSTASLPASNGMRIKKSESSDILDRNLDLDSFESQNPILDGISISLRVLCCTGATILPDTGQLTPGLHGEVSIEIDEPTVKLTARQLMWLQHILKQGFGTTPPIDIKLRPRTSPVVSLGGTRNAEHVDALNTQGPLAKNSSSPPKKRTSHSAPEMKSWRKEGGSLRSVWEAIVGENSDETVDDAAIALGLWKESDVVRSNGETAHQRRRRSTRRKGTTGNMADTLREKINDSDDDSLDEHDEDYQVDDRGHGNDDDDEALEDDDRVESRDRQNARSAVSAAAACGGTTWNVRLRTADSLAWDRVRALEKEISAARVAVTDAEAARRAFTEAQEREAIALKKAEEANTRANLLAGRNETLAKELRELERFAAESGQNKDAVVRQLQSALANAQRNIQLSAFEDVEKPQVQPTESAQLEQKSSNSNMSRKDLDDSSQEKSVLISRPFSINGTHHGPVVDSPANFNFSPRLRNEGEQGELFSHNSSGDPNKTKEDDSIVTTSTPPNVGLLEETIPNEEMMQDSMLTKERGMTLNEDVQSEERLAGQVSASNGNETVEESESTTNVLDGDDENHEVYRNVSHDKTSILNDENKFAISHTPTPRQEAPGLREMPRVEDSLEEVELNDTAMNSQKLENHLTNAEADVVVLDDDVGDTEAFNEEQDEKRPKTENMKRESPVFSDLDRESLDAFYNETGTNKPDQSNFLHMKIEEHMDNEGLMLL